MVEIIPQEELAAAAAMSWADDDAAALMYTCGSGLDGGLGDVWGADGSLAIDLDL